VDSSKTDGSKVVNCILDDDADTTTGSKTAVAYSGGRFNRLALTFGGTDTAAKHEETLRELGIFLSDNIPY